MNERVLIAHMGSILEYPPILNLIMNLLVNKKKVTLISGDTNNKIPRKIRDNVNFNFSPIPVTYGTSLIERLKRRFIVNQEFRRIVDNKMKEADVIWTTTDLTVRCLGKILFKYKHVMQLMELEESFPLYRGAKYLKFGIDEYARKAWKVVVPEENRAYIQKVWWNLPKLPYVLPNKPYQLSSGRVPDSMKEVLNEYNKERRKVVLYLGIVGKDRNLDAFATAIDRLGGEYCLYIVGSVRKSEEENFEELVKNHVNIKYLGYFPAPKHLLFLKKAYIGVLPYIPGKDLMHSSLNALYCAPNKIYEYSGYGVPMLGTNVLGLKLPFEKFKIGFCGELNANSIKENIKTIEKNYDKMSSNCFDFFNSTDLDEIVRSILEDR